jgi:hypothetical protein
MRETHMSPLDALYAFEDLGAEVLIPDQPRLVPLGYEPSTSRSTGWRLAHERQLGDPSWSFATARRPRTLARS